MADDFDVIGRITVDDRGSQAIRNLNSDLDSLQNKNNSLGTMWDYVWGNIILKGIDMVIGAFQKFLDLAASGLDAVAYYERITVTLESLAASELLMAHGADNMAEALEMTSGKAEILLDWMQQLAIHSPFSMEGVQAAFVLAEGYGFTADQAMRLIEAEIDYVAGTGRTEYAMQAVTRALGQISATGKLMGQDMMQLTQVGVPVAQILADAFGVTTAEIMDMRREGLLPAQETIEAITVWMETNFAGAADRLTYSWGGLKNTMYDVSRLGLKEFFEGILEAFRPLVIELANFLQGPGLVLLGTFGDLIGGIANNIFEKYQGWSESPFILWLNDIIEKSTIVTEVLSGIEQIAIPGGSYGAQTYEIKNLVNADLFRENLKKAISEAIFGGISEFDASESLGALDEKVSMLFNGIATSIDNWVDSGGPYELSMKLISWIDNIEPEVMQSKSLVFAGKLLNSLYEAIMAVKWDWIGNSIDQKLAEAIEMQNWEGASDSFRKGIIEAFADPENLKRAFLDAINAMPIVSTFKLLGSDSAKALAQGFSEFFVTSGNLEFGDAVKNALKVSSPGVALISKIFGEDTAKNIFRGFDTGMGFWDYAALLTPFTAFINAVRKLFRIESPSGLFYDMGKDIVQGLVNGLDYMMTGLKNAALKIAAAILGPIEPLLSLLNIDLNLPTSTGTTGSRDMGGVAPGGGTSGTTQSITNNFYGAVYVGSMQELYECDYPNPVLNSTQTGSVGTHVTGR